jgi:hypothetical protein
VSTIIFQDDKAKIDLGVPAVDQTFRILQSINDIANHDFLTRSGQKLIPSVYLIMKPEESKDELQTGQLAIFVCSNGLLVHPHLHICKIWKASS